MASNGFAGSEDGKGASNYKGRPQEGWNQLDIEVSYTLSIAQSSIRPIIR